MSGVGRCDRSLWSACCAGPRGGAKPRKAELQPPLQACAEGGCWALRVACLDADMDMKYRVVVVGGGPSGACAAEEFAKDKNIETVLLEVRAHTHPTL